MLKGTIEYYVNFGADKNVLTFIDNFLAHTIPNIDNNTSATVLMHTYLAGYCYYFAKMLEDAFPGGKVCLTYPINHIVYVYDNIPYDINGVTDVLDYDELIEFNKLPIEEQNGFKRI